MAEERRQGNVQTQEGGDDNHEREEGLPVIVPVNDVNEEQQPDTTLRDSEDTDNDNREESALVAGSLSVERERSFELTARQIGSRTDV